MLLKHIHKRSSHEIFRSNRLKTSKKRTEKRSANIFGPFSIRFKQFGTLQKFFVF